MILSGEQHLSQQGWRTTCRIHEFSTVVHMICSMIKEANYATWNHVLAFGEALGPQCNYELTKRSAAPLLQLRLKLLELSRNALGRRLMLRLELRNRRVMGMTHTHTHTPQINSSKENNKEKYTPQNKTHINSLGKNEDHVVFFWTLVI